MPFKLSLSIKLFREILCLIFLEKRLTLLTSYTRFYDTRQLPQQIFSIPKYGTMNLHGSLLPKYRGAAPIQRSILNGDKVSGVSTFIIDKNIDTGNVILQSELPIRDKNGNQICGEAMIMPDGTKLNQGKGFDYSGMSLGLSLIHISEPTRPY